MKTKPFALKFRTNAFSVFMRLFGIEVIRNSGIYYKETRVGGKLFLKPLKTRK